MNKEELALQITRAMYRGHSQFESHNTYKCFKGYVLDLEEENLVGIATQYGINAIASKNI